MRNGPEHKATRIDFSCHKRLFFYIPAPWIWLKVQSGFGWVMNSSHRVAAMLWFTLFVCFSDSTHPKSIHIRYRLDNLDIIWTVQPFGPLLDFLQQWSFHKILLFFSKSLQSQVPLGLASCVCLQSQVCLPCLSQLNKYCQSLTLV